jgi:hypothetical protein
MYFDCVSAVFIGHREGTLKQNSYINCFHELQELKTTRCLLPGYIYKVTKRNEYFVSFSREFVNAAYNFVVNGENSICTTQNLTL